MQETLIIGDLERGPRGTNEHKFQQTFGIPPAYQTGCLIESWDVTAERIVFDVRPGIYWAADNVDYMESREFTAEDLADDITRYYSISPFQTRIEGIIDRVYTTDRYTCVVEFAYYSSSILYYIGFEDRALYSPPETEETGINDSWEDQVGTGAFIFEEYELGSHMSYTPNPNYWQTTTIDGVEYDLPFIDRLIYIIIPDEATQFAALKTGAIDYHRYVPISQWDMLDSTAPYLEKQERIMAAGGGIAFRTDQEPFDDVKVRQAMCIGIDLDEFRLAFRGAEGTPKVAWPLNPQDASVYTALEDLPADTALLYTHNPTLAIQMLDDAGYPDGFTIDYTCESIPARMDVAALLKDQWAEIGVTVNIIALDAAHFAAAWYPSGDPFEPAFSGISSGGGAGGGAVFMPMTNYDTTYRTGAGGNFSMYSNPEFDALLTEANLEFDSVKQTVMVKELAAILQRDVPEWCLYNTPERMYWAPWIKNYYGEFTITDDGMFAPIINYMWIDQDLQAEGY